MKKIAFILGFILAVTGCATGPDGQPLSKVEGTAMSAGIGCVGGALLAKVIGGKPGVGCLVGGVAGGLAGYVSVRQAELANAKQAQAEIPGARLETQPVVVSEADKIEKVTAFKSLSVPIPGSAVATADGRGTLNRLAALAVKNDGIVTVSGGTAEQREAAIAGLQAGGAQDVRTDLKLATAAGTAKGAVLVRVESKDQRGKVTV